MIFRCDFCVCDVLRAHRPVSLWARSPQPACSAPISEAFGAKSSSHALSLGAGDMLVDGRQREGRVVRLTLPTKSAIDCSRKLAFTSKGRP